MYLMILTLSVFFLYNSAAAQNKNDQFSLMSINGGVLSNSNRNLIHQYWKPGKDFFLSAEVPFYFGKIQSGIFYSTFNKLEPEVPDFKSYFIFLGWGKDINLPLNLRITNGFRIGSDFMKFSSDSISVYESIESELAVSLFSQLNFYLYSGFHINLGVDYTAVFTRRRIQLFFISAGAGYEFKTPGWLKEFLE